MMRSPRRAIANLQPELAPESGEPQLKVATTGRNPGGYVDQPLRGEHAHVSMENRPSHFKRGNQGAIAPPFRPVLQTQIADSQGGIGCCLNRKGTSLDRGSRDEAVRQIGELLCASLLRL